MDNKKPLTFVDLEINDIKVGQLLVMSYPYHSDYRIGIVNGIDKASPFPLTIFEVKKDLSPGIRQTEIENIERIKAIIDPSKVKKHTTKYLISLAMKYEVSFDGLLYLKTTNKK